MTHEARKMLDDLDEFLSRNDNASAEVAAILSALRGPDLDDVGDKRTTTMRIRRAAFPKLADVNDKFPYGATINVGTNDFIPGEGSTSGIIIDSRRWAMGNRMGTSLSIIVPLPKNGCTYMQDDEHFSLHAILAARALGLAIQFEETK